MKLSYIHFYRDKKAQQMIEFFLVILNMLFCLIWSDFQNMEWKMTVNANKTKVTVF